MKQVLFLILFIIPIFVFCQKYYLKKGKRKIELIQKSPIAIFTNKDSIVAKDNKGDFSIFTLTKDSITIRRPDKTKDTVLEDVDNPNFIPPNWDYIDVKWYRKNRKEYHEVKKILDYEYRTFSYSDIKTIYYVNSNKDGGGCIGCFLIPGLNVIYILTTEKHIKKYDLNKWKIFIQ